MRVPGWGPEDQESGKIEKDAMHSIDGQGSIAKWEKQGDQELLDCRIFRVLSRQLYHPGRETQASFYIIDSHSWVNVLALTEDQQVVLVRQYRFGSEEFSIEPPGGVFEPGENPVEAGVRELLEETGYSGDRARIIGQVYPNPAILNNHCYFVLVENARKTNQTAWDEHEEIEVLTLPWREAVSMAAKGEITHSLAVSALFYLQAELQKT